MIKQCLKQLTLCSTLAIGSVAQAVQCDTDSDCLSAGLSLIKRATKAQVCASEVKGAVEALESVATPGEALNALEACIAKEKFEERRIKRLERRRARIQRALSAQSPEVEKN